MQCEECDKDWFSANYIKSENHPVGFKEWAEQAEFCKYTIYLPDGSEIDAKLFIDFNSVFDNFGYTNFILNIYKDINGL